MSDNSRRTRGRRCCGCFLIFTVPLALILWSYAFSHDWNLWRLDRSYRSIKHPYGTTLVTHRKEVGLLIGHSNHCDYFVGELRTYSGSKQNVLRFYKGKTVWNPISGKRNELEVAFINNGKVTGYKYPHIETPYPVLDMVGSLKSKQHNKSYYLVYVLDAGYSVGLDIRCI